MRAPLILLVALSSAPAAADTIIGSDEMSVSGTMAFVERHTFEQRRDIPWTGTTHGSTIDVTVGKVVDDNLEDGRPRDTGTAATYRDDVVRALAYEGELADAIAGRTFTQDVPIALGPDELAVFTDARAEISARRVVITWAGTAGDVAHYRLYGVFALGGSAISGQVSMAGTIDLDVRRHALVEARLAAVIATTGLARIDAKASAHLTRRYR